MHDDRPSLTAVAVSLLRGVAPHPQRPGEVVDPLASAALPTWAGVAVRALRPVVWLPGVEVAWRYAWAGLSTHVVYRTLAIDEALSDAINAGCRQVVLLGAGFDTRPLRLPALAQIPVWEVDHPATQAAKQRSLPDSPSRYVPVDFNRDDLGERLAASGLDPRLPTVVIWEGVTPYLPPQAIAASLAALAPLLAPKSRLLVTFCLPELTSLLQRYGDRAHGLFRRIGEPLVGMHTAPAFHGLLMRHGFRPLRTTGCREWTAERGQPAPWNVIGEELVVAERSDDATNG